MMAMTLTILTEFALAAVDLAQDVNYNFDRSTDFSNFRSYKWIQIAGAVNLDPKTTGQLTTAIEKALAAKGLTRTDSDNPDLFVGCQVALDREKQISTWGMGPRVLGGGMDLAQTSTIRIGSLDLDMYDSSKELVWRGVATKAIDPDANPDKRQKNFEKGAEKLLRNYPPKIN